MERTVRRGEPQTYAQAVGDLWEGVGAALVRLERIAESAPATVADDFVDELPALQYSLHSSAELAVGIEPPPGSEELHGELVEPLLPEWRGVLFRVRLARLRVLEGAAPRGGANGQPQAPRHRAQRERASISAVVATLLVVTGAFLFTAGAVLAAWPVWAAGLALFAGGFVLYRP